MNIELYKGIPGEDVIDQFADGQRGMIVLDDLMDQVVKNEQMQHLFTRTSHHRNVDVVYINQNMFAQGKHARTVNLNSHYLILLKNLRDTSQINILGRQLGLGSTLGEAEQPRFPRSRAP